MSIFDSVKQMVGNEISSETGGQFGLLSHAMDLVNDPNSGGLQGLVEKFHANGLGDAVNSWVGQGGNQAISADQVKQVLGSDKINAIASKFGISPEEASGKMAQLLPSIVDKLTPGGSVSPSAS